MITSGDSEEVCQELAKEIREAIAEKVVVDWQNNLDARNAMLNAAEDRLLSAAADHGITFDGKFEVLDHLLEESMRIAKAHFPGGGKR
jgi:hypothetical protein